MLTETLTDRWDWSPRRGCGASAGSSISRGGFGTPCRTLDPETGERLFTAVALEK